MLEIEDYYGVDDIRELDRWQQEFNIPPREMAPVVLESNGKRCLTAALWSLMGPWADSLEHANKALTFNAQAETLMRMPEAPSIWSSFHLLSHHPLLPLCLKERQEIGEFLLGQARIQPFRHERNRGGFH
jgi:SOS response associated peptidase (SRAP)